MSDIKPETTHSSSCTVYRVECRATGQPFLFGDTIIGTEWQRLPTVEGRGGVHCQDEVAAFTHNHGYYQSFALAAWFMSGNEFRAKCRIVPLQVELRYEIRREDEPVELDDWVTRAWKAAQEKRDARATSGEGDSQL